jgi:type IV pilus assembly protein PilY1
MKFSSIIAGLLIVFGISIAQSDDTEIYGTITNPSLEPNVLIIFDTSGSMATVDVPGDPYDPNNQYTGLKDNMAVYVYSQTGWYGQWNLFTDDVSKLKCEAIKKNLDTMGYAEDNIRGAPDFSCGGLSKRRLRIGNYVNYISSGVGNSRSRISVAKDVLKDIVDTTTGVRFGLMKFNFEQGGRLVADCGASKSTVTSAIENAQPDGWTPLAETLAEAGLYFAGKQSWFNAGVTYTSPMQERCQKNYIIIMTDGEPTHDNDSRLTSTAYINGDKIGDYDKDGQDPGSYTDSGSHYLDDVAKYLYENDCNLSIGDGTSFDKQNITTFTIGYKSAQPLLQSTAKNGGGEYFTAQNYSDLKEAFTQIISNIVEKNACFVAPVVPISRMNRVFAGDKIYLGFFKPQQSGRWIGNIKRYSLENDGTLLDATGANATTPDGLIKDNSLSWWTSLGNDGPAVEKGGAAEALRLSIESGANRNVFTYTGTQALLTDPSNAFTVANNVITKTLINVSTDNERTDLITLVRESEFGDIIHSEPAVILYPDSDGNPLTNDAATVIYVGANDGMLHAINDDTGKELWSFVPRDQLERLPRLIDADHDYFVDGSPVVYTGGSQKIMIFGERRGGDHYTALDITNYSSPRFLYTIGPNILDPNPGNTPDTDTYERLGQSWSRPEKATIATSSTVTTSGCNVTVNANTADVFLFAGGYDNNQDNETPASSDNVGRAVFAVNTATGQLMNNLKFSAATHSSLGMTHSVLDVSAFDHDGDGIVSRIYFGDLGGNLFALKDDTLQTFDACGKTYSKNVVDGTWTAKKLFSASADGVQRKIMYAPDAVQEQFGEYLFFGTGDRENPDNTTVINRFYAIKNDWTTTTTLTEADLVDVTEDLIQLGTEEEKQQVKTNLTNRRGWYIRLENAGEKVISTPRVYGGVVYLSTYTPSGSSGIDPSDPCASSTVRGVARLYAVNYQTGASMMQWNSDVETDKSGNTVALGKKDRSLAIGTAIPSAPVIAVLGAGAHLFVGVEGGIASLPTVASQDMNRFFWKRNF